MWVLPVGSREIEIVDGDITKIAVDAIVNAANADLVGGGGVDGAIHRAGGPEIMRELDVIRAQTGHCRTGSAVATGAGLLPAKFVFHAVGPIYRDGKSGEADLLASCYRTCLEMADERGLKSISFPSVSTGAYAFPFQAAAKIALEITTRWLHLHEGSVRQVKLVQFGERDHHAYVDIARREFQSFSAFETAS